jgi:hypothetical protein
MYIYKEKGLTKPLLYIYIDIDIDIYIYMVIARIIFSGRVVEFL